MKKLIIFLLVCILPLNALFSWPFGNSTEKKLKADLLGKTISQNGVSWQFDSLSEFKSFTIKNDYDVGETKEYEVEMELEDYGDGEIFAAVLLMTYKDDVLKKILVKELKTKK